MTECLRILKDATKKAPRLGQLEIRNVQVDTPHYLANTSRGVVPHLTQDNLSQYTAIAGLYASLEDFIERTPAPIYQYVAEDPSRSLRQFLAVPEDRLLVIGVKRSPAIIPPPATSNTNTAVAVSTSVGFRFLETDEYADRIDSLSTDIVVGLADIPIGRALVAKRIEKATDRSVVWVNEHLSRRAEQANSSKYFASLLPVSCANQQYYVDELVNKHKQSIDGLAIYSLDTMHDLHQDLSALPRMGFTEAATPLQALQHIQQGLDLLILPFVDVVTDAGIAMTFQFPQRVPSSESLLPIGADMWDVVYATDLASLLHDCSCYACTKHHRAYVQHLLSAKEMLGWVLLQIHNHHIMSCFFQAVRESIANQTFEEDLETFARVYEPAFPAKTGQGPRVRGYQRRSEKPNEPKRNPPAFVKWNTSTIVRQKSKDQPKEALVGLPDDIDLALLAEEP